MSFNIMRSQSGQALLAAIMIVDLIVLGGMWTYVHYSERQTMARIDFLNRFLLEETTSSTFEIMEAALRRRLWEAPPDASCLKARDFSVRGQVTTGSSKIDWEVIANYNPVTKVYELAATGKSSQGLSTRYLKQAKVKDASDYLFLNTGTNPLLLYKNYQSSTSTSFIGGSRQIYSKGALWFYPAMLSSDDNSFTSLTPAKIPEDLAIVVQSERIQAAQGLRYIGSYGVVEPNDPDIANVLKPYSAAYTGTKNLGYDYYAQSGGGVAIVTNDLALANAIHDATRTGNGAGLDRNKLKLYTYPAALFGGNGGLPLLSHSGKDTGAYNSNFDRWPYFHYGFSANNWGLGYNGVCFMKTDAAGQPIKQCSDSGEWPEGFKSWRKNAKLEETLLTKETADISLAPIDWDNLEALEEDAGACGAVVEQGSSPRYTDCQVWDYRFLQEFVTTGNRPRCQEVSQIDLDNLPLKNIVLADYDNDANVGRWLRRVIYVKGPAEFKQQNARGLRPGLNSVKARNRLSLWVVSDDVINLRGYRKAGETSPVDDEDYTRIRELYFNVDTAAPASLPPLRLVIMSPENIHLISPGYVPMSESMFARRYSTSGGKLIPKMSTYYDAERWENDAYRFGVQQFKIQNLVHISNSVGGLSTGIYMKGLWAARDSSAQQLVRNQCFFNKPGTTNPIDPNGEVDIPGYADDPDSNIPPTNSYFYDKPGIADRKVPQYLYPRVFTEQTNATPDSSNRESGVEFLGLRLLVDFDSTAPAGKRSLNSPKYVPSDAFPIGELPNLKYIWPVPRNYYYKNTFNPQGVGCTRANIVFRDGEPDDYFFDSYFSVNDGRFQVQHLAPPANFADLGALFGVDMPMIQSKE